MGANKGRRLFPIDYAQWLGDSAAAAYLRPAAKRRNLSILTDTQVGQILFAGRRAVGVTCRSGGSLRTITAKRGVILAAGAIQSPQLLMLSGIGPADALQRHGIAVKLNRPAVGQNLQDHLQFRLIYRIAKPITTNDALRSPWGRFKLGWDWLLHRRGALAVGINQGGLFARVDPPQDTGHPISRGDAQRRHGRRQSPRLLRHDIIGLPIAAGKPWLHHACLGRSVRPSTHSRQLSRGGRRPRVRGGEHRLRTQARGDPAAVRLHRRRGDAGPNVQSDDDILRFARANGATIFHPAGTCRMGADEDAVVDPQLRVRGADRLWVADCSIMPTLVSGNTSVPAMMIAEKAADLIMQDQPLRAT